MRRFWSIACIILILAMNAAAYRGDAAYAVVWGVNLIMCCQNLRDCEKGGDT